MAEEVSRRVVERQRAMKPRAYTERHDKPPSCKTSPCPSVDYFGEIERRK